MVQCSNGNGKEMYTNQQTNIFRKLELSSYINFGRNLLGPANYRIHITLPYHIILI